MSRFIVDYLRENSAFDFEYVHLDTGIAEQAGRPAKYFLADYRDYYSYADHPYFCVHSGTTSPATLLRNLGFVHQHRTPTKIYIFEARNISQCKLYLLRNGWSTGDIRPSRHVTAQVREKIVINSTAREIQRLELVARQAQERLLYLQSLPKEPEGKTAVIKFTRRFSPGGKKYHYAAIKTKDGWYTTGPRTPKAYSWQDLIAWINAEGPVDVKVMVDARSVATLSELPE
jgi:hypothetical protein